MYEENYGPGRRRHRGDGGGRGWGERGWGDRGWGGRGGFRGDRFDGDTATAGPSEEVVALRQALFATVSAARQVARDGDPDATAKATELLNQARKGIYRLLAGDSE
jgi:hypothetical protein